jgi:hypothetical protein
MRLVLLIISLFMSACGALNTARPLAKGEHKMGVTGGGAVLKALGPPIPLPNLVVEGQSGLSPIQGRPLDVNYGLNTTALAFGTIGLHGGVSHLLMEQNGGVPSLSVTDRLHFYNNWLDNTKESDMRKAFFLNQVDLTAGWNIKRHLGYVGVANYLDIADPELTLAPFAGIQLNSKKNVFVQAEIWYLAINRQPEIVDVPFVTFGYGAISVTGSVGFTFGGE